MKTALKILLLEDSKTDAEMVQRLLKKEKMQCIFYLATDKEDYIAALESFEPDIILSDHSLPQFNSAAALEIARHYFPFIPFIMVTGTVSEEFAAEIIKKGADDYILKDRMQRLPVAITTALSQRKTQKEIIDYKYALDQSAIVAITNQRGKIIYANENFCKISGYTKEELLGKDHRIINSGYHPSEYIKALWTTIAKGKIWSGEFRNKAKDGSIYWVYTTIVPFLNNKKKPYQYLSIRIDITERKHAAEALQESEMRLNEAQAMAHIGNWEIDFIKDMHVWSKELYRIFGFKENEVSPSIGFFISLIHPDDKENAKAEIDKALQEHKAGTASFRFIRKNNKTGYGHIEWRFVLDSNGKPQRLFGILQDITEHTEAEHKLKMLEQQIMEQSIQEQKKITRAIMKAQERERNYLGQELHDDINQKLAAAKMYLSISGKKNEEVLKAVQMPLEVIEQTVEDIRRLCREMVIPEKNKSLEEMITDMVLFVNSNSETKTDYDCSIETVSLSEDLKQNVFRIIQEQVNNIVKYAEAGQVLISIKKESGQLEIITEDNGKGFDTSKKKKGIGINNIKNRVESFNGTIELFSMPGKGCRWKILLPLQ